MRKIVQIAAVSDQQNNETVFALCEDGTLWSLSDSLQSPRNKWQKVQCIPNHCHPKNKGPVVRGGFHVASSPNIGEL